jgi:hypothetical protein
MSLNAKDRTSDKHSHVPMPAYRFIIREPTISQAMHYLFKLKPRELFETKPFYHVNQSTSMPD